MARKWLGSLKATTKASAIGPVPRIAAMTMSRTNPVARDRSVQAPTDRMDLSTWTVPQLPCSVIHTGGLAAKSAVAAPGFAAPTKKEGRSVMLRPKSREETPKEGCQTGNRSAPSDKGEFSVHRTINKCRFCIAAIRAMQRTRLFIVNSCERLPPYGPGIKEGVHASHRAFRTLSSGLLGG